MVPSVYVLLVLSAICLGRSLAIDIQKAESDLAAGGSRVCPYCSYCVYQSYCDGSCTYTECSLCKYRYHCSSTCTSGVCNPHPCSATSCGANQTCFEITPGRGECRCHKGSICSEDRTCIEMANKGICDFYTCLEDRRNCGSNGYMLNYGRKYCNRFGQHFNSFSDAGKKWIVCARECLTKALIRKYQERVPAGTGCDNITSYAFHTHVDCYHDCGFCHIWNTNKLALLSTYQLGDFLAQRAITQVLEVAKKCLHDVVVG